MFGIFPWNYSFLLQEQIKYYKDDNPEEIRLVLIIIGSIILLAVVFRIVKRGSGTSTGGAKKKAAAPRKFNTLTLLRISSAYGLSSQQSKLLKFIFRNDPVNDPERVMKTPEALDRHFKKAYKYIESNSDSDEETQFRLVNLYALRNLIDAAQRKTDGSDSTPQISANTAATLVYGDESYPVKIISSRGNNSITDTPKNALGSPIKIAIGAKITLSFLNKANSGFSFEGQVTGAGNTSKGPGLKITHTGKIKPLAARLSRRRQVTIKCDLFKIHMEETVVKKKKTKKLVVDKRKVSGTVQDISAGGCAIKTSAPVPAGERLKINIDNSGKTITALGLVLRTNKSGYSGTILHIKFLKVPLKSSNAINKIVFGFDQDDS